MSKRIEAVLTVFSVSTILLTLAPLILINIAGAEIGMTFFTLSVNVIDPLYFLIIGLYSGMMLSERWYMPFIPAFIFLASSYLIFEESQTIFILYCLLYIVIGAAAMLICALLKYLSSKKKGPSKLK